MSARKRITAISQKNEEGYSRPSRKNPITFNFEVNEENKRGNFPIYLSITENRKHRRFVMEPLRLYWKNTTFVRVKR